MKTSLHVENDLRFLPVCTSCAESFAALSVEDAARRNKIVLCVEEAFCHTVEHAYEAGETGEIVLGMAATPSGMEVTVQDHGLPFERTLLDTFDPRKALEQADVKGLGLLILQKTADQVVWENRGYEGNFMRMTFLRPAEDVTQCEGGGELKVVAEDAALAPEQEYTVRLATPEDAVHVSRCIYRAYGYSYPNEDMYYPDRIREMLRSGDLISAVTVAENGEIVGHVSLAMHVKNVLAESGQAVVNPAHRGRNLFEKMKDLLQAEALRIGLTGICGEPVTNHLRSQKTSLKTGNRSCGLSLALLPESMGFRKLEVSNARRTSCVYNYMHLGPKVEKTVHITGEFAPLVKDIYAGCGFSASADTVLREPESASGEVHSAYCRPLGTGVITVRKVGADCGQSIRQGLYQLTMKTAAAMVYLDLPLEDSACAFAIEEARKLGFVFCALGIAADNGRDFLRLQFVNCEIDFDQIQITGDMAQRIFGFVKAQMGEVRKSDVV